MSFEVSKLSITALNVNEDKRSDGIYREKVRFRPDFDWLNHLIDPVAFAKLLDELLVQLVMSFLLQAFSSIHSSSC